MTIDGTAYPLPLPFFVIATQNNIELSGTYALPEAQLDRFAARIAVGYPDRDAERQILINQRYTRPVETLPAVLNAEEILAMQAAVRDIHIDESVQGYILDIVGATRLLPTVLLGASPRGSLSLMYACQAKAALAGRNFVKPDNVKASRTQRPEPSDYCAPGATRARHHGGRLRAGSDSADAGSCQSARMTHRGFPFWPSSPRPPSPTL